MANILFGAAKPAHSSHYQRVTTSARREATFLTFKSQIPPRFFLNDYLFSSGDVSQSGISRQPRLFTSAAPQSLSLNIINVYLGLLSLAVARLSAAVCRLLSSPEKFQLLTLKQTMDPFAAPSVSFSSSVLRAAATRPHGRRRRLTCALCDLAALGPDRSAALLPFELIFAGAALRGRHVKLGSARFTDFPPPPRAAPGSNLIWGAFDL